MMSHSNQHSLTDDNALPTGFFESNQAAHIIQTDAEAIDVAKELAITFAKEASQRDAERRLPLDEIKRYSQSGLWGINIPKKYGGAEVKYRTLAAVVKIISSVDPSLGQIAQNHWVFLEHIRLDGSEKQQGYFFHKVLSGERLGNAFSEKGSKTVADLKTTIRKNKQGYEVNGEKFFATGAFVAHWIPVVALDEEGAPHGALVPRQTPGLELFNDWSSFGQRTTISGTVRLKQVKVDPDHLIPLYKAFERPTAAGAISQYIQAAVDAGIAHGAIEETIEYVRRYARPWIDAGVEQATEDPYTIFHIGELKIKLHAAEAILDLAGDYIDEAIKNTTEENVSAATLRVAEAKVLTTEIAMLSTNKLFELSGTRSTLSELNLDRHWRNARTHTLHDPVRWKFHIIGNYYLNNVPPPRHPWS